MNFHNKIPYSLKQVIIAIFFRVLSQYKCTRQHFTRFLLQRKGFSALSEWQMESTFISEHVKQSHCAQYSSNFLTLLTHRTNGTFITSPLPLHSEDFQDCTEYNNTGWKWPGLSFKCMWRVWKGEPLRDVTFSMCLH